MERAHIAGVVGLQSACFPPPFPPELLWSEAHLMRHLELFPEGQFVAIASSGVVVGSASGLVLSEEQWLRHADWETTVGGHYLEAHDPHGTTFFGADVSVHPDWRGIGVARAMFQARFELVRTMGLKRYGTACRIPGWREWSLANAGADQEVYCRLVANGETMDSTMTPLTRMGLRWTGLVRGHMEDYESGDAAAILEWSR